MALEERALADAGEKAEVLALGRRRDREPGGGGDLAHLRLGQVGEREAKPRERARRERREHVGLVLGGIGRSDEQRPLRVLGDARVMTGREAAGTEAVGERDHRVEPQLPVAAHAGVRGPALGVPARKSSTTAARKPSSRSIVRCGRPIE